VTIYVKIIVENKSHMKRFYLSNMLFIKFMRTVQLCMQVITFYEKQYWKRFVFYNINNKCIFQQDVLYSINILYNRRSIECT